MLLLAAQLVHFKFFKHIQTLLLLPPQPLTITELLR